jgi:hypothetical protein
MSRSGESPYPNGKQAQPESNVRKVLGLEWTSPPPRYSGIGLSGPIPAGTRVTNPELIRLTPQLSEDPKSEPVPARQGTSSGHLRRILYTLVGLATVAFAVACTQTHGTAQVTLIAAAAILPVSALAIDLINRRLAR